MMAVCAMLAEQAGEPPVSALLRAQAPSRELALVSSGVALEPPCSGSIHDREGKVADAGGGMVVADNAPGAPEGPSQARARQAARHWACTTVQGHQEHDEE